MEKCLKDFQMGESGVIKRISGEGSIKRKLFDMGLTPGAKVIMKKTAPLLDPIQIKVRNYDLSIRISEADLIFLEVEGSEL